MAESYSCRPSELLGLNDVDPMTSFYLDRAVFRFGTALDAELEAVASKAKNEKSVQQKQQLVMNRWLRAEGGGRFKDPAAR